MDLGRTAAKATGMGRERMMDGECAGALAQQESMPGTPGTSPTVTHTVGASMLLERGAVERCPNLDLGFTAARPQAWSEKKRWTGSVQEH